MDIVSQILLSLSFIYAFFYKKFGYWSVLAGCFCTLLMDIPPFFTQPHFFDGLNHAEGFSHSLLVIPISTVFCAGIGYYRFKAPISFSLIAVLCYTLHLLLDLSASNGVALFAPFLSYAPAIQSLSQWDIFFIIPLLLSLLLTIILAQEKWVQFSFVYSLLYIIGAHLISLHAYQSTASIFKQIGFSPEAIHITTPPLFFFTRRLSVKDSNNRFACTYYSPFLKRPPEIFTQTSLDNALIQKLIQNETGKIFSHFTKDMMLVQLEEDMLIFSDARYGSFIDPWSSPYRAYASMQSPSLSIVQDFPRRPFRDEIPQAWKLIFPSQENSR